MAVVYKVQSPSGREYVGVTSGTGESRLDQHAKDAVRRDRVANTPLSRAIRKYGRASFSVVELLHADMDECLAREQEFIDLHGTMRPRGYNAKTGGVGGVQDVETRKRMSKIKRQQFADDPEIRLRMSLVFTEVWNRPGYREKMKEIHLRRCADHKESNEVFVRRVEKGTATRRTKEWREAQSNRMLEWWRSRKIGI